jgi:DNA polymerase III epsilon subunit-like protein
MSKLKVWTEDEIEKLVYLRQEGLTWEEIEEVLDNVSANCARKAFYRYTRDGAESRGVKSSPKVLIFDIETAPIEAYVWGLFDQNIGLEMIKSDWSVLSWSAKWLGAPASEVMYRDQRNKKDVRDDKEILQVIWSLLDEADVVITQNGIKFDSKKLNARFVLNGMKPPSSYKHIDTLRIAKSKFAFTSNKLAYMTEQLCVKYKKLDHGKFAGFKLWKECLAGNLEAWAEMELYNKHDVLALEELYVDHLAAWDNTVSFDSYTNRAVQRCNCGNDEFEQKGYHYTKKSKFRRFICTHCGKETRDSENLFTKEKRKSLRV